MISGSFRGGREDDVVVSKGGERGSVEGLKDVLLPCRTTGESTQFLSGCSSDSRRSSSTDSVLFRFTIGCSPSPFSSINLSQVLFLSLIHPDTIPGNNFPIASSFPNHLQNSLIPSSLIHLIAGNGTL